MKVEMSGDIQGIGSKYLEIAKRGEDLTNLDFVRIQSCQSMFL